MPGTHREEREENPNDLLPDLQGWQIFFIVASVIIGEGIFSGDRDALEVAGPAGTLLALMLVGILSISVMGCVSELVQLFPVPNAIVEYIKAFVDEDLALCCGFAYWYTWSSIISGLYLVAVQFTSYWSLSQTWSNIIFIFAPFIMIVINLMGVNAFGIVETIGGILKLCLTFGTGVLLYHLYSLGKTPQPPPLYDGFDADQGLVNSAGAAVFFVIPTLTYSFLGVESVAVTAFEASSIRSLRGPSRWIAWVITGLYGFTLISELLVFSWTDPTQPYIYGNTNATQNPTGVYAAKHAMAIVATERAGYPNLAGFLNGCYMFSALSGSNSALYVASRTLYGLSRNTESRDTVVSHIFKKFSKTTSFTRVPALAIIVSGISFAWLPFLIYNQPNADAIQFVDEILVVTASVMCLIVWAALCLAFIRFRRWFELCRPNLDLEEYARFDRESPLYKAKTGIMPLQPFIAWVGLIGSLLVVLVFISATWWNGDFNGAKFALAYVPPLLIAVLWILRKLWTRYIHSGGERRGWVKLTNRADQLISTLVALEYKIPDRNESTSDKIRAKAPWLFFWDYFGPRRSRPGAFRAANGQSRHNRTDALSGDALEMDGHLPSRNRVMERDNRGSLPGRDRRMMNSPEASPRTGDEPRDSHDRSYSNSSRGRSEGGSRRNERLDPNADDAMRYNPEVYSQPLDPVVRRPWADQHTGRDLRQGHSSNW